MFKKIGIGLAFLGGTALGVYLRFIRPWLLRWGTSDEELQRPMPGDDEIQRPLYATTRARKRSLTCPVRDATCPRPATVAGS